MSNSSIWPIDKTLSVATTTGDIGPGSNVNEKVLHSPEISYITGAPPSYYLVSYPEDSFGGGLIFLQKCGRSILQP